MKNLMLTTCLLLTAVPSFAGGPVIEERYDTEVAGDRAKVNPLVIVGALTVACLILCRDKDSAPVVIVPPPPCNGDC